MGQLNYSKRAGISCIVNTLRKHCARAALRTMLPAPGAWLKSRFPAWKFSVHTWKFSLQARKFGLHAWKFRLHAWKFGLQARKFRLHAWKFSLHAWKFRLHAWKFGLHARKFGLYTWKFRLHAQKFSLQASTTQNRTRNVEFSSLWVDKLRFRYHNGPVPGTTRDITLRRNIYE